VAFAFPLTHIDFVQNFTNVDAHPYAAYTILYDEANVPFCMVSVAIY
jgi:hypothetical protein